MNSLGGDGDDDDADGDNDDDDDDGDDNDNDDGDESFVLMGWIHCFHCCGGKVKR